MKRKFLIPVLGLFALALTVASTTNTDNADMALFASSDNVAFAFAPEECGVKVKHYCIVNNSAHYDMEYCGSSGGGNHQ